jgi:transposase-like protein
VQFSKGELMSKGQPRYSIEKKVEWAKRILAGESVKELSRKLGISERALYKWRDQYWRSGGAGLSTTGLNIRRRLGKGAVPPPTRVEDLKQAKHRIEELERKLGQQSLELDFFRTALRHVGEVHQGFEAPGAKPSTKSSRR